MSVGGRSLFRKHTCMYSPTKSGRKTGGGPKKDNTAQIYTDTKQEMELCEIIEQKHSLDCCANLGHKQC